MNLNVIEYNESYFGSGYFLVQKSPRECAFAGDFFCVIKLKSSFVLVLGVE